MVAQVRLGLTPRIHPGVAVLLALWVLRTPHLQPDVDDLMALNFWERTM
nr:MAG TPA: hypothetical protein [Caudoviricetes sp.]